MEKDSLFPLVADLREHVPKGGECTGRKGLCSLGAAPRGEGGGAQNRGLRHLLGTPTDFTWASCLGFPPDVEMGTSWLCGSSLTGMMEELVAHS